MNPRQYVQKFRSLPNTRNVLINTIGNYIGFAFAGFYTLFLVRVFAPVEFGMLSLLLVTSYLLANILSFGMPASIYANLPTLAHKRKEAFGFLTSNLIFLTSLSSISLLIIFMFIQDIDRHIIKSGAEWYHYLYALIGTQLYIWQNFIRDALNAANRFLHANIAMNVSNLVKAVVLIWLAWQGLLGITEALIVMGIVGPIVMFAIVALERRYIFASMARSRIKRSDIKIIYTFKYFVATQLFQLATRADIFFISYFLTRPEVGLYGLSQRIILAVVASADSITQVMSPQFAKINSRGDVKKALRHSFGYMLIPSGMFALGIVLPNMVYELVFGATYNASTLVTKALSFSYIPFSFLAAVNLFFLYTVKKPDYLLVMNALYLIVVGVGNWYFVPLYGLFGPAIVNLSAFAFVGVYSAVVLKREYGGLRS